MNLVYNINMIMKHVYVLFTGAAQSSLSTVERYDPRTNTWNTVASMNIRRSLLNVAVLDGKYDITILLLELFKI